MKIAAVAVVGISVALAQSIPLAFAGDRGVPAPGESAAVAADPPKRGGAYWPATAVVDGRDVKGTDALLPIINYVWQSPTSILVAFRLQDGRILIQAIDTESGVRTDVATIDPQTFKEEERGFQVIGLSPDGRWLMGMCGMRETRRGERDTGGNTYVFVGIGHPDRQTWPARPPNLNFRDIHWLPDNRHWFVVRLSEGQKPATLMLFTLGEKNPQEYPIEGALARSFDGGCVIGMTPAGEAIWLEPSLDGTRYNQDVYAFSLGPHPQVHRVTRLKPPGMTGYLQDRAAVLAPSGDRFIVIFDDDNGDECPTSSLRKCSLNNGEWHTLLRYGPWSIFGNVRWSPDGKRVCFLVNETLVAIP